jgi:hypothetical protein
MARSASAVIGERRVRLIRGPEPVSASGAPVASQWRTARPEPAPSTES